MTALRIGRKVAARVRGPPTPGRAAAVQREDARRPRAGGLLTPWRVRVVVLACLIALLAPAAAGAAGFGMSAEGRALKVARTGDPGAPVRVLVVGSIHGNETAGHAVIARLRRTQPPPGVQLWLVRTANPDGIRHGTRQNARGVDLNRNFPFRWAGGGRAFDAYFPGRAAASEPETRALQRLIGDVRPDLTVYYHQHMRLVALQHDGGNAVPRAYARLVRLPARTLPYYRGTATSWQRHRWPGSAAFVVELSSGELTRAAAGRHARAVLAVAPAGAAAAAAPRPEVEWDPIPFGAQRKRQMRRYSRRHYGDAKAKLVEPKVIVEHHTATSSFDSAFNTFASNAPDVEFGELPGVCAHYLIDRDGTIRQLVSLRWRCRHTVGLNDMAIGIEHVGVSDADVMGRPRQLAASLLLTRWLQGRFGIRTRDVIGHAESLASPYHHELVAAMRKRTHGDFGRAAMRNYRARLG
jgi:N-acetylmuramoyl-L-alanine amidase/Zinc carboxypeptidase